MKTNSVIVGIIAAVVLLGGFIYWTTYYPSTGVPGVATTTPTGTDETPAPVVVETPAQPVVMTSTNTFPSDTTVVVSGNVTPNGAPTSYWYEFGTTSSLGKKTAVQNIGSGYGVIPAPLYITGLVKDTPYYFRLVAMNQFGTVTGAPYSFRTTIGTAPPIGNAPTTKTLAASSVSTTTANLNGEVTPNQTATQYWFEYGITSTLGSSTALQAAGEGSSKNAVSISLSNLRPGTTYQFRMNAQNQFGTINGAILTFKTK